MKINNGYKHIKVKLLSWDGDDIARKAYEFGKFAIDDYRLSNKPYSATSDYCQDFVQTLLNGTTFPKLAMFGNRLEFSIEGISRICLAQFTRDNGIFASESHGLRPLSQELNIPMNLFANDKIMEKFTAAQKLLEEAYIMACESEIPYPESRYLCSHAQTISLCVSFTPGDFARCCYSRTNNSFCDELNYVYRKMYYEIRKNMISLCDENSIRLWNWLLSEKKCIDDNFYTRTVVYNGDFMPSEAANNSISKPATNDWRKSGWKLELERMLQDEPNLLTRKEMSEIYRWRDEELCNKELASTYNDKQLRVAKNAIKRMDYYNE